MIKINKTCISISSPESNGAMSNDIPFLADVLVHVAFW